MTREEALARLADRGIEGLDAETALSTALRNFRDIDSLLNSTENLNTYNVLQEFGQDAARVVLALRET